jgi:anaerobic selenocysteine-containing dehydrogenase
MRNAEVIPTLCGMCGRYAICGINAAVEDGKIVKVEGRKTHPLSKGFLCHVGRACLEYQYSPERLTHPMRKRGSGWERISWDDALEIIVSNLEKCKEAYGEESLAVYLGQVMTPMVKHAKRFCDLFGTPNITSAASFCQWSGIIAHILTFGAFAFPDVTNSRVILVWGSNPPLTNRLLNRDIEDALSRGAKLLVVDPRKTQLAGKADLHIPIRPGTDGALALGLLNLLLSEGLYDEDFVRQYTIGLEALEAHTKAWTPERVERITWVPEKALRRIAGLMARYKPCSIVTGISPNHATNGCQAFRAIADLIAISGNLDVKGGNVFGYRLPFKSYRIKERFPGVKGVGVEEHQMFFRVLAEAQAGCLAEAMIEGRPYPIKAMLVQGGNPVSSWPDTNRTLSALNCLDFLVVMDTFMTETAKQAHILLPSATFFERPEWIDYGQMMPMSPTVILQNQVVEPAQECWPDWRFWFSLGRKMGYGGNYPWSDIQEAMDWELSPSGITFKELAESPDGIHYGKIAFKKYEPNGFNTPSKKVELYSSRLEKLGQDPLPVYIESTETPASRPDLLREYPFMLITGARSGLYQHSQFRQCASLRESALEPEAEINPETSRALAIQTGDVVRVSTARGAIKMRTLVTDTISPGIVGVPHGWADSNANILTDNAHDPISGFPPFRAALCNLSKTDGA